MGVEIKMFLERLLFSLLGALSVHGHGNMMWPPTWFDPNGTIGLTPGGFMHGDYETAPWTHPSTACLTSTGTRTKCGTRRTASLPRAMVTSAPPGTQPIPQQSG